MIRPLHLPCPRAVRLDFLPSHGLTARTLEKKNVGAFTNQGARQVKSRILRRRIG
jgi:hypothetical protein